MTAIEIYQSWLENKDCDYHNELLQINNNTVEIQARFGCDLSFGTGGIRAETGAGTNRMNVYVVP